MRILVITLGVLLAAGCAAQNGDTGAPVANTPGSPPAPTSPAPPQAAPQPPTTTSVPARFRGDYAVNADACTSSGHVTQLAINASTIQFHESSGDITAIDGSGNKLVITAQLTGEGETHEADYSFVLSDDDQTLTDTGNGMLRVRCD